MIIERIKFCDFRVFRGEHEIDLAPRKKYGKKRPIILFGGLNGAGKTTILNAVRLTLYGKHAFGHPISQSEYDQYLRDCIHKSSKSLVKPNAAIISLEFAHSKLGEVSHYRVIRAWSTNGKQLKETLQIDRNGESLSEVTDDQCQSFLNELVPIGVSDLFFFDGEKIAELADEEGSAVLGDAVKRLLGLDLIDRLRSDLNIYIRRQGSQNLPDETRQILLDYETEFDALYDKITLEKTAAGELANEIARHEDRLRKLEEILSSKGGAWASERASLKARQCELEHQKETVEDEIRTQLGGLYPLSLAPTLLKECDEQLTKESALKQWLATAETVKERLPRLNDALNDVLPAAYQAKAKKAVSTALSDLLTPPENLAGISILHDLGNSEYRQLQSWINEALTISQPGMGKLVTRLEAVEHELAQVSLQLERAPDTDTVKEDLDAIKQEQMLLAKLSVERDAHIEQARKYTWQAIELTRTMRKLESKLKESSQTTISTTLAGGARSLLNNFADELRKRKIASLEREFENAFARLARKEDILVRASIDPFTFDVTLFGKNGKAIEKKQLSAGEKQIYAISMLEALARTSGRRLPIIIDTPLGRLDSKHRRKLVEHYFPHASHQVIVLSTDTEVDEQFYSELGPNISHAFNISYDEDEGGSSITEGYFWKYPDRILNYAS